jgi:CBS domain-containing protein
MVLREVLHAHIPVLRPDSTVRDAIDRMDVYQFPALVMIDETRWPVAVVTEGDLCRAVNQVDSLAQIAEQPVLPFATRQPIVGEATMDVGDAFHRMLSHGITLLPVVEDGALAGVVLRMDLMQAMCVDAAPENG